ncbi:UNVERIFIED_CONTAM: hypothetical protein FKN15_025401 [Acipenser sinensis]
MAEDAIRLRDWILDNAGLEAQSMPIATRVLWLMDRERWEAYEREHTPNTLEEGVELVLCYLEAVINRTAAQVAGSPVQEGEAPLHRAPGRGEKEELAPRWGDHDRPVPRRRDHEHPVPRWGDREHPVPRRGDREHPVPRRGGCEHLVPRRGDRGNSKPEREPFSSPPAEVECLLVSSPMPEGEVPSLSPE